MQSHLFATQPDDEEEPQEPDQQPVEQAPGQTVPELEEFDEDEIDDIFEQLQNGR